jgi:hypothetical protein
MKRFRDNVVLQVTERHLLGPEGPVKSLSPGLIADLADNDLMNIAGENFSTSSTRNDLKGVEDCATSGNLGKTQRAVG